ncbi:epoxyqueuosine reductase QueH [Peptoniphilus sp. GNH]|nr:epoxyqueuosine reductase QueH [Peptoniphilus sp. GNH]
MNNINYNNEMEKIINSLDKRPRLLLHSCCGPCSTSVLERLASHFDLTIFFYNPNIYPEEEFYKRARVQKELLKKMGLSISLVLGEYDDSIYYSSVKGFENQKEGSLRCYKCYEFRMREAALYAKKHAFDYFTTTLSVSPYKRANWINEIGLELEKTVGIKFLYSDFKKKDGYKRSIELSKTYDLYRQDYCGCSFSKKEAEEKLEES